MDIDKIFPNEILSHKEAASKYAEGKFVTVDGKKIHYIKKGQGKPVVMLHGFLLQSLTWQKSMDALARQFTTYAMDIPGFGYSQRIKLDGPLDFRRYAPMVKGFLDVLGLEKVSLIGHSMGGGVAVRMAALYPDRVERIVLSAPHIMPYSYDTTSSDFGIKLKPDFLTGKDSSIIKAMLAAIMLPNHGRVSQSHAARYFRPLCIKGTHLSINGGIQSALDPPFIEEDAKTLARLKKPVLLVHGSKDPISPGQAFKAFTDLSNSFRLKIFKGIGHTPHEECPERFNDLAYDFLA